MCIYELDGQLVVDREAHVAVAVGKLLGDVDERVDVSVRPLAPLPLDVTGSIKEM